MEGTSPLVKCMNSINTHSSPGSAAQDDLASMGEFHLWQEGGELSLVLKISKFQQRGHFSSPLLPLPQFRRTSALLPPQVRIQRKLKSYFFIEV